MRFLQLVFAVALVLAVSGAGTAEAHARPVLHRQVGLASFYGYQFAGRPTASGRDFHPDEMVAAHRTLPLGTTVRVTNLENGRSVTVEIIDRGPYRGNRRRDCVIDVSRRAASRLGFIRDGLTRVRVDVLRLPAHRGPRS
jgi:rare lipoprotein A